MIQNDLISLTIVMATLWIIQRLEQHKSKSIQKILAWFPAILFAYVIPALITHLFSLDMTAVRLHYWSKWVIMPLAVITVMSALSFKQLRQIGLRPIIVFLAGSLTVATAPLILLWLTQLFTTQYYDLLITAEYWKGLVTLVGSWIGGSTSQLVLKEAVNCEENLFLIILVMDNVLVNLWTLFMFQFIKRSDDLNQRWHIEDKIIDYVPNEMVHGEGTRRSVLYTALCCLAVVGIAFFLQLPFVATILIISAIGLLLGNFVPFWNHTWVLKVGGVFIILIMAILGLKLDFSHFSLPTPIILFAVCWLISHFLIMLFVARVLKLHIAWVPIGSMANVGGISTAPAVTKAYNIEWMPHAILLAILSMVTGTVWGLLTIYLFQQLV